LKKEPDSLSDIERALLDGCHWLRLGMFASDRTERIIFLNSALEFVTAEISAKKVFEKEKIKEIKNTFSTVSLENTQKEILENSIDSLNNAPLFERIKQFCESENIVITNEEWDLIHSARKKRNEIIHGKKDVQVTTDELEKLQSLIEKILTNRLEKIINS